MADSIETTFKAGDAVTIQLEGGAAAVYRVARIRNGVAKLRTGSGFLFVDASRLQPAPDQPQQQPAAAPGGEVRDEPVDEQDEAATEEQEAEAGEDYAEEERLEDAEDDGGEDAADAAGEPAPEPGRHEFTLGEQFPFDDPRMSIPCVTNVMRLKWYALTFLPWSGQRGAVVRVLGVVSDRLVAVRECCPCDHDPRHVCIMSLDSLLVMP